MISLAPLLLGHVFSVLLQPIGLLAEERLQVNEIDRSPIDELCHRIAILNGQVTAKDESIETAQYTIDMVTMCGYEVFHHRSLSANLVRRQDDRLLGKWGHGKMGSGPISPVDKWENGVTH